MIFKDCFFFFLLWSLFCNAQVLPPVETYLPEDYHGENQNWSISQDSDRHIYVANNKGLLEFNGAEWQLYPSPNQSVMRSVCVVGERIYTGCYMEFGFWERDAYGMLQYTSLSNYSDIELIEDEQFWNIISVEQFVVFQSLDRIYIYNSKQNAFNIIDSETTITKMYLLESTVYFQEIEIGISKIENGKSVLVSNDPILKNNIVISIFSEKTGHLIVTQNQGLYDFSNQNLVKRTVESFERFSDLNIYHAIQLSNGDLALGTISRGLLILNNGGELRHHLNQSNRLSNNTVLSIKEDLDNNLWLALDNGINCINVASPISIYNDVSGQLGTVYASEVYSGKLYLGTNQGLFCKSLDNDDDFQFIEGTKGQVWTLQTIEKQLFCGHNDGTFIIDGEKKALIISNEMGAWKLEKIPNKPDLLLQGNYSGLHILQKQNDRWKLRNKIDGFDISSRYFELVSENQIFVSHEYKGVYRLVVSEDFYQIEDLQSVKELEKGFNSSLVTYDEAIWYAYEKGIFRYFPDADRFKKDSLLTKVFLENEYSSGKLVADNKNRLWNFSDKGLIFTSPGKFNNNPTINNIAIPRTLRKEMVGYENITHLANDVYLFGTSTGYLLLDLKNIREKEYSITINNIQNYAVDGPMQSINKSKEGDFRNDDNNIEFTYSVPEFDKYLQAEYQYQLEGYSAEYSNWSTDSEVLFKNLPFGDYLFKVRARVGNSLSTNEASYRFSIDKPWYLTTLMLVIYMVAVLLFSIFMHTMYKRYYKRKEEQALHKSQREMELQEMENEQRLMHLENEKLQQDIDNKSRELAISTMSLIKKNEFLKTVKEKIKISKDSTALKQVIRLIDNNLNNTDDWKFFQEAFNNADKDFLNKVKTLHPSLTPNDLRLCAYLRLNLSSKEIAPLLNISHRSVEVKRYRLRKKINLQHEDSLTEYILGL